MQSDLAGREVGRNVRKGPSGRVGQRNWELGLFSSLSCKPCSPDCIWPGPANRKWCQEFGESGTGRSLGISHPLGCGQHFPAGAVSPLPSSSTLSPQYLPGSLLLWFQAHQMNLLLLLGTPPVYPSSPRAVKISCWSPLFAFTVLPSSV